MKVLVDTSVWIDYINDFKDSEQVLKLDNLLLGKDEPVLCPVVYQEVLQGIRDDSMFSHVKSLLKKMKMLSMDFPKIEDAAIDLYRSLRKQGITIRKSNDCLIAAYALTYGVPVLFKDRDFEAMCTYSPLRKF
mgnify:CR=1 FL=1